MFKIQLVFIFEKIVLRKLFELSVVPTDLQPGYIKGCHVLRLFAAIALVAISYSGLYGLWYPRGHDYLYNL